MSSLSNIEEEKTFFSFKVFCAPIRSHDCTGVCGSLYFFDHLGKEITFVQVSILMSFWWLGNLIGWSWTHVCLYKYFIVLCIERDKNLERQVPIELSKSSEIFETWVCSTPFHHQGSGRIEHAGRRGFKGVARVQQVGQGCYRSGRK